MTKNKLKNIEKKLFFFHFFNIFLFFQLFSCFFNVF